MASRTRRYHFVGPNQRDLIRFVQAAAKIVGQSTGCVDIEIDDAALDGAVEQVDEYMLSQGFQLVADSPAAATGVRIVSPDGSTFEVIVDNAGVLSATKLPQEDR